MEVTHAITLKGEDLAQLIVMRVKPIENRDVVLTTEEEGEVIAVHAGKSAPPAGRVAQLAALAPHITAPLENPDLRGKIIGVCRVAYALPQNQCAHSPWAVAKYKKCNIITAAALLPTPIAARGNVYKWPLPDAVRNAVNEQLATVQLQPTGAEQMFPRP